MKARYAYFGGAIIVLLSLTTFTLLRRYNMSTNINQGHDKGNLDKNKDLQDKDKLNQDKANQDKINQDREKSGQEKVNAPGAGDKSGGINPAQGK